MGSTVSGASSIPAGAQPRKVYLNPDYRHTPKTDHYCIRCQRDLVGPHRWVHLIDGGTHVLHPDDEHLYVSDAGDMYWFPIGNVCAQLIGVEFTKKSL